MNYLFKNGKELLKLCDKHKMPISEVAINLEAESQQDTMEYIKKKLTDVWTVMQNCIHESISQQDHKGWLIGGEARKIQQHYKNKKAICGDLITKTIMYSMGVLEINASMGLIVAAPTAGSSGVLPAVLLAAKEEHNFDDEQIIMAIANAGAIGSIISTNANVSGAEGGCQAEIGSASSMAASALVELFGGTPRQCFSAAGYAIQNMLGLVCDPVGGLVEVPCQSRNALGATGAFVAAELALSGIEGFISFDEVVDTLQKVGDYMSPNLKETAKGGIAATKSACKLCKRFKSSFKTNSKSKK